MHKIIYINITGIDVVGMFNLQYFFQNNSIEVICIERQH
jgi:hypothetical protein